MKSPDQRSIGGFTLLEVIISLGVFVFAITIILASLGSSSSAAANDARRTLAGEILNSCFQDLSLAGKAPKEKSPLFGLEAISWNANPAPIELWFDTAGTRVPNKDQAFYKCEIVPTKDAAAPVGNISGRIEWPAKRAKGPAEGETELFTSVLLP